MLQPTRSRSNLTVAGVALVVFFALVSYILGPLLLKQRSEHLVWYGMHIVGGTLVMALGPFQFVASLRDRFRRYHRAAGYTYVLGSTLAIVGYIGLPKSELFLLSQIAVLGLWLASIVFAVVAIRNRNVEAHQRNMARSFVFAAYFLTARLFDKHGMWLLVPFADSESVRLAHSDWLAWIVPLVLLEVYFGLRAHTEWRLKRARASASTGSLERQA